MTDKQIIKAIECCAVKESCDGCPMNHMELDDICARINLCNVLDLINRQRADFAKLQHKYDLAVAEREANVKGFTEILEKQRAEIERKDRILDSYALQYGTVADKDVLLKRARVEAVKEFAERLKEEKWKHKNFGELVFVEDIDNIAKEMVGEQG